MQYLTNGQPDLVESSSSRITEKPGQTILNVTGTGKVYITSDRVVITVAVETQGTSIGQVQAVHTDKLQRLENSLASIQGDGKRAAEEGNFLGETTYTMQHEWSYDEKRYVGYSARSHKRITLTDLSYLSLYLQMATIDKVSRVASIEHYASDALAEQASITANVEAVKDAKRRAAAMASAAGFDVAEIVRISEPLSSSSSYPRYEMAVAASLRSAPASSSSASEMIELKPQKMTVSATVEMTLLLRPR